MDMVLKIGLDWPVQSAQPKIGYQLGPIKMPKTSQTGKKLKKIGIGGKFDFAPIRFLKS